MTVLVDLRYDSQALLAGGLYRPTGAGDVIVAPVTSDREGRVRILLRPRGKELNVVLSSQRVLTFVRKTEALIPSGTESLHLGLDDLVERLTTGA
ncbi:hypothetical protein ABIA31_007998 [Catenulispora sp. MAP5-51]|uniref:SsgA family sporulation/cell division regulator n=1 Tax=Catenulispora sp. MAP5-51 TaxID=3156298 RepID=UPI003517AE80